MNPFRATLTLVTWVAVVGLLLLIGCQTMPQPRPMPPATAQAMLGYSDPPHPSPMPQTNVLSLPQLPGTPVQTVTNVSIRPIAHALAVVVPPKVVTNTNSVQIAVPPNTDHLGRAQFLTIQSTMDFKTWKDIAQVPQMNGSNVVGNLLSTNPRTFYRSISTNDLLPPLVTNNYIIGTTNKMR